MLIIGLGSNEGDRLQFLRLALAAIKQIDQLDVLAVSPVYLSDALLPPQAPSAWNKPYLNAALRCKTKLTPHELLNHLKQIEKRMGRGAGNHWSPRVIDLDILAWDDLIIKEENLIIPHQYLPERPFALWPLADIAPLWIYPLQGPLNGKTAAQLIERWGSRFSGEAPLHTRQLYQRIDTPILIGILNITPDSFSDGGKFLEIEKALQQVDYLIQSGAEIIDVGAESTAPTSHPIDQEIEWARLSPLLSALKEKRRQWLMSPKISVDTRYAATAQRAIALGADWINDVSGLDDQAMREIILQQDIDCVVMHHLSIPERRTHLLPRHLDPVQLVYEWGENRLRELEHQGFKREKIIFDPGIGFGKMAEQSLLILKNSGVFKKLGCRLLIGPSRKTFQTWFTNQPSAERDIETMSLLLALIDEPIDYIRVHQVEMCARGIKTVKALQSC